MKTFKQFITESKGLKELIYDQCMPFISESKKANLMYRGSHSKGGLIGIYDVPEIEDKVNAYEKEVRKDRTPLSTWKPLHDYIDHYMKEKFDINGRKGSMFCMGKYGDIFTGGYGKTNVVFPIGDFKFLWSPHVEDLFDQIEMYLMDDRQKDKSLRKQYMDGDKFNNEELDAYFNSLNYTDRDLDYALSIKREIMVECDRYISIPIEDGWARPLSTYLGFDKK
jgi:hypothetical protein